MAKRAAGKSKNDVALQAQSTKDKKDKGKWFDNKGRRGYNNSDGRGNQHEENVSKQRRPYQGNERGGVVNRGRGGGRKPDKSHI